MPAPLAATGAVNVSPSGENTPGALFRAPERTRCVPERPLAAQSASTTPLEITNVSPNVLPLARRSVPTPVLTTRRDVAIGSWHHVPAGTSIT